MNDREACIILNMIGGIGPARMEVLVNAFGSPAEILKQSIDTLCSVSGIKQILAQKVNGWQDCVDYEKEMRMVEQGGVELITRYDANYPQILKEISDPPLCLYIRGHLPECCDRSLAIVGSRRISSYGHKMAKHLSESAAYNGWAVISGLAYGIDSVAHQACIDAGGVTIGVLGGGLARIHPQEHIPLARQMVEKGAVISEFPMTYPPCRRSFPMRNRIVSGLAQGTIVVEAGLNSGSLITANQALEQGRIVFAVPGQADAPQSRGCNQLIRQGAKLVENFDDILDEFEFLPGMREVANQTAAIDFEMNPEKKANTNLKLTQDEDMILAAVKKLGESSLDQLATSTGLSPGKLLSSLMKLEVMRQIRQLPGKKYKI